MLLAPPAHRFHLAGAPRLTSLSPAVIQPRARLPVPGAVSTLRQQQTEERASPEGNRAAVRGINQPAQPSPARTNERDETHTHGLNPRVHPPGAEDSHPLIVTGLVSGGPSWAPPGCACIPSRVASPPSDTRLCSDAAPAETGKMFQSCETGRRLHKEWTGRAGFFFFFLCCYGVAVSGVGWSVLGAGVSQQQPLAATPGE